MESPFANANQSIVFHLEPILNSYSKTYQNIITLNTMPSGPLANMVTRQSPTKLSIFQEGGIQSSNCMFILLRYPKTGPQKYNQDCYMGADDIPSLLSWLNTNGYTIETEITKMLYKSRVTIGGISESGGDRRMICMARFL